MGQQELTPVFRPQADGSTEKIAVGKEIIEIGKGQIVIHHQLLGLKTSHVFQAYKVYAVYESRRKESSWIHRLTMCGLWFWYFKFGKVAINYGKTLFGDINTYRFGASLSETETLQVLNLIHKKFPHYKYRAR